MGGGGLVCAEEGVVLPSCRQGLPDAAAYAIRLQRRVRELAGWVVGTQKSLVLPSCRQGLPAADDGVSPPRTLRLQRRVRELAGWVVGTQKSMVLPAQWKGVRGDALPDYSLKLWDSSMGSVTMCQSH